MYCRSLFVLEHYMYQNDSSIACISMFEYVFDVLCNFP